jgi:hypothetical protein
MLCFTALSFSGRKPKLIAQGESHRSAAIAFAGSFLSFGP